MSSGQGRTADLPDWAIIAARAADEKLATDTVVLEVGDILGITEHFVITGASNTRLVRAVAEFIEEEIKAAGGPDAIRVEGKDALEWVLLDFGEFVAHVFHDESRGFYDLERLWSDVPRLEWREASIRA
ncbi:MAG: ribosome silencing factor [Actinomycetia bacterium]|nr:ribosome silencing factor [Actinomycetes bacterium]